MAAIASFVRGSYDKEKPFMYAGPPCELGDGNILREERALNITDLRTVSGPKPSLETHGFCYFNHKSKEIDNITSDQTSLAYAAEMAEYMKELFGATLVVPVQSTHNIGSANWLFPLDSTLVDNWDRMKLILTEKEQEDVLTGMYRVRMINLWRPMKNHAEDWPLAMLDIHSLDYEKDTVPVDHVSPATSAEILLLRYNPNHRWFWMSNQTPDEAILFTSYDSHPPPGMPNYNQVGHVAFRNEAARPDCPPRRSIEVRYVVVSPLEKSAKSDTLAAPRPVEPRKRPWRDVIPPDNLVVYTPTYMRNADGSVGTCQGVAVEG
ncbi:hypothetical protein F5Y10DRAFT_279519 [Nemania abortiva]|nr:hypothetical protein F5Y10DRAFT_279519 [Nemania abortiva]